MKTSSDVAINTIRGLAIDMVEEANSGHPGLPLGAAPIAYTLFTKYLKHNPKNPKWYDRDRFILSAGHGSALLYALLYLCGYGLTIEDLKGFRKWGSKTPGHPEYGQTPGVEATTGPLGQGFAIGVGMALAEKELATSFNREGFDIVNHYTYALVSDGDLMEGVTAEAASLAGTQKLGKLIYLYDNNHISIDGDTSLSFTENVKQRFDGYGWHTQAVYDINDTEKISRAIEEAKLQKEKPSLILVRTHIGFGSPKQDTTQAHGEPLGAQGVRETKINIGLDPDKKFQVPQSVSTEFEMLEKKGQEEEANWQRLFEKYKIKYPEQARVFEKFMTADIPKEFEKALPVFSVNEKGMATREASGKIMNAVEKQVPQFIGGAADLAGSTKTVLYGFECVGFEKECDRNIHFGVREHAMAAAVNGLALHGGFVPYCATFLVFSDYMRPAIRLAAIMGVHSIFVFTHDSIGLGEDGPTHQPIEQLTALRAIPGFTVYRPADANETAACWHMAIVNKKPCALILSRQALPIMDTVKNNIFKGAQRGAYILREVEGTPDIIMIATGSEVQIALAGAGQLALKGIKTRVVSMPSMEIFRAQDREYKNFVLPPQIKKRLTMEAGASMCWYEFAGSEGVVLGIDRFGASAAGEVVMEKFGFNTETLVKEGIKLAKE